MKPATKIVIALFVIVLVGFAGLFVYKKGTESKVTTTSSSTTPSSSSDSSGSSSSSPQATSGSYTLAEVAKHTTKTDCWMAIHGNVYNVTDFASSHPGGEVIYEGCGKDATQLFETQGGTGGSHNSQATEELSQLKIGSLAP